MPQTDPDFLSLVEENRFQPKAKDINSPKALARDRDRKKAYWNENIALRLVLPQGGANDVPPDAITWNIPRFRLTEAFLRETVNRGRPPSSPLRLVSHLHDEQTNTVILPKDLAQCRAAPVVYRVHVNSTVSIEKGGVLSGKGESYYDGDLIFRVSNLPRLSKSEKYEVVPDDVRRWLVHGAASGVEAVQIQADEVENLTTTLERLEKDAKSVHSAPIYNEHGRAVVGSPLKDAREAKFRFLQEEAGRTKERMEKSRLDLEEMRDRHLMACTLLIDECDDEAEKIEGDKVSFLIKVAGKKRDKAYYTDLILDKTDWSLVPVYATGVPSAKSKSRRKSRESAAAAAPPGEEDEAERFVDAGAVSVEMLPDGFGVHESYDERDPFATDPDAGDGGARGRHRVFHGRFRGGEYRDGTLHADVGVYSGTFEGNEPSGGTMKYSDGVALAGEFDVPAGRRLVGEDVEQGPVRPNPYRLGLPHGKVHIQFKDGSLFEGIMDDGRISGSGVYKYPVEGAVKSPSKRRQEVTSFNEIRGDFADGRLQNNDGISGKGGSNLLRSLMVGSCIGERLWGP
ncbi:hypothetical protein ACHAWF_005938 [Thalassiosira exigua]